MESVIATRANNLKAVRAVILDNYREELWLAIRTELAVIGSLSLQNRDHCLVLIFEGPSGHGKSIVTRTAAPDRETTRTYLIRVDDFTPASFVSHAANRNKAQLKTIDLLPRLKDKTMVTKELAPLFRADEKELKSCFSTLTAVLDGDGYLTNSGSQGERGYQGRYIFNWLGATTPVPERTHKIMAQLGNRLLFYEIIGEEHTEIDLVNFANEYDSSESVDRTRTAVNNFIEGYFDRHPVGSVSTTEIIFPDELLRELIRYAQLIAHGRVEVSYGETYGFETGPPEGPHRVILLLKMLTQGLALTDGRTQINTDDLAIIRHIAFSSLPPKRRELLRILLGLGGKADTPQIMTDAGMSRPTALRRMEEFAATDLGEFTAGNPKTSTPATLKLAKKWDWLLGNPLNDSGLCASAPPLKG